jgi:hypothetical protein
MDTNAHEDRKQETGESASRLFAPIRGQPPHSAFVFLAGREELMATKSMKNPK